MSFFPAHPCFDAGIDGIQLAVLDRLPVEDALILDHLLPSCTKAKRPRHVDLLMVTRYP